MKNKGEEKKEGQGKIRGREGRKKTGKEEGRQWNRGGRNKN